MSDFKKQLELDIKNLVDSMDNMSRVDKEKALKNMFEEYLHLNSCDYLMDNYDLQCIITDAKTSFANDVMPVFLGEKKKKVKSNDLPNFVVIESTIRHLYKNNCLKKVPKFDKRDDEFRS